MGNNPFFTRRKRWADGPSLMAPTSHPTGLCICKTCVFVAKFLHDITRLSSRYNRQSRGAFGVASRFARRPKLTTLQFEDPAIEPAGLRRDCLRSTTRVIALREEYAKIFIGLIDNLPLRKESIAAICV